MFILKCRESALKAVQSVVAADVTNVGPTTSTPTSFETL